MLHGANPSHQRFQLFPDRALDDFQLARGIDDEHARGLLRGDFPVALFDPFKEATVSLLDPVAHTRPTLPAGLPARFAYGQRHHQQPRPVGPRLTHGKIDDGADSFEVELTAIPLVSHGRITKTIA